MDFSGTWDSVRGFFEGRYIVGLEAWRMAAAAGVFLVIYLFRKLIVAGVIRAMERFAAKTKTDWDDLVIEVVEPPIGAALQLGNVFAAVVILKLPRTPWDMRSFAYATMSTAAIVIGVWALVRSVRIVTVMLEKLTAKTASPLDDRLVPFVTKFLRVVFVIIGGLLILQTAGLQIGGILAGLGIGGLAIALAAKDMLANVFGSLTIVGDHPFEVGDWIKTPFVEGTVEDIGFRSTKVRTFANSQVNVPNASLANAALENFSRMFKRRISYNIGVTYETTPAQLREALERIRDIVRNQEGIRQDFWLVYFTDFAESALEIMVYCFTKTTVWAEFLEEREKLNLSIIDALHEIGVEFAFPSRALYMREDDAEARARHSERCAAMLQERLRQESKDSKKVGRSSADDVEDAGE